MNQTGDVMGFATSTNPYPGNATFAFSQHDRTSLIHSPDPQVRPGWKGYAVHRLTYPYDRDTLAEARPLGRRTRALVVLRHGKARSRAQAQRLVPLLAAFDVTVAHSSSSTRCVQTVAPYAEVTGWPVKLYDELSEEGATAEGVVGLVDALLDGGESAVLCTHRPVLPTVLDALRVPEAKLEPGAMLVVHHRKGRVVASEQLQP